MNVLIKLFEWMNGWIGWLDRWLDGWIDGWTDRWMDGKGMNESTIQQKEPSLTSN